MKKISILIVLMIICLSFSQSLTAKDKMELPKIETYNSSKSNVKFTVTEFKEDGSIDTKIIECPEKDAKKIIDELNETINPNEILNIYKKYGIIRENVSLEEFHQGMIKKSKTEKLEKFSKTITGNDKKYMDVELDGKIINSMCLVFTPFLYGVLNIPLGLTFFTNKINNFLYQNFNKFMLPSVDLMNTVFTMGGAIVALNGSFPDDVAVGFFLSFILIGFVGIVVSNNFGWTYFTPIKYSEQIIGYTAFVCGFGLFFDFPPDPLVSGLVGGIGR